MAFQGGIDRLNRVDVLGNRLLFPRILKITLVGISLSVPSCFLDESCATWGNRVGVNKVQMSGDTVSGTDSGRKHYWH